MFRSTLPTDGAFFSWETGIPAWTLPSTCCSCRLDLAVFWINSELQVVDKVLAKSWRPAYVPCRPARYVLELHPDHLLDYEIGDKVGLLDA